MIYECPHCHAPQEAGHTACPECGAEFEGPVPEDAVLPAAPLAAAVSAEPAAAAPEPLPEAVLDTPAPAAAPAEETVLEAAPLVEEAPVRNAAPPAPAFVVTPAEPVLETVYPPAPAEEEPYQRPAYQPPSYSTTPAYTPPPLPTGGAQAYTTRRSASPLPKILLIALPFVLLLVLVGYLISRNLEGGTDTASTALPVTAPVPPTPAATPVGSPTVLQGGTTTAADDTRIKWLAGRWQSKDSDFFVFNTNGSGSQGSVSGKLPTQDFLWRIVGSNLMLYGAPKDQEVRFSVGPDDSTVYLRDSSGKAVQYTREVQSEAKTP